MRQKYKIAINSEIDREPNSSRDNFRTFLSRPVSNFNREIQVGLRKAVIPNTAYTFHPNDNYLWYVLDGTVKNIQLDTQRVFSDGEQLAEHLTNLFGENNDTGITVEQNENSKKLVFSNSSGVDLRLVSDFIYETEVNGTSIFNHSNVKLGLIDDMSNTIISDGQSYSPSGIPRLVSTFVYNILSKGLVSNTVTTTPSPNDNPHILASLLNNKGYGDLLTIHLADDEIFWFNVKSLNSFDIIITDDQYRPISLNGGNVYLELEYQLQ